MGDLFVFSAGAAFFIIFALFLLTSLVLLPSLLNLRESRVAVPAERRRQAVPADRSRLR